MIRFVTALLTITALVACSLEPSHQRDISQSPEFGCISQPESAIRMNQLLAGIRGQVRFVGEQEEFKTLQQAMTDYQIPAVSLAVIHNGQIDWTRTAQLTGSEPLNCRSIFQAASLSKPVTVMAAMRMHEAEVIDLDQNIEEYLLDFVLPEGQQSEDNPVTLRNIFTHTSGITPGGYQGYEFNTPLPSDLDIVRGAPGVNSPKLAVIAEPNSVMAYSGGGYTLAELALQNHLGGSFSALMDKWILAPAVMTDSDFRQPLPENERVKAAIGHLHTGEAIAGGWHNYPEQAAAGLWSNSRDMARFLIEIYQAYQGQESIFSQAQIRSMLAEERDRSVYGFIVDRSNGGLSVTHYGGNAGYRTGMTIDLVSGNGLVYLANSDNGGLLGNELLLSTSQVYDWQQFQQVEVQRSEAENSILENLVGDYLWNDQVEVRIGFNEAEENVSLYFPNGDEYPLTPIKGEELDFIHASTGVKVSFLVENGFNSFLLYGRLAEKISNESE